jgi:hypothetical protein
MNQHRGNGLEKRMAGVSMRFMKMAVRRRLKFKMATLQSRVRNGSAASHVYVSTD